MTAPAWVLLAATVGVAMTNWWAVEVGRRSVEYVCKPATMVALIGVASALRPDHTGARAWFVVAAVCSLAGDVFLMLPRDRFVPGLASFLLGHIAYVIGLVMLHRSWALTAIGLLVVAVSLSLIGPRIVGAVRRDHRALVGPVLAYIAVISLMVVSAWGSAIAVAIVGALLFYASDATLAWNRFVAPQRHGRVAVMVTYHLGQIGLVLSLVLVSGAAR